MELAEESQMVFYVAVPASYNPFRVPNELRNARGVSVIIRASSALPASQFYPRESAISAVPAPAPSSLSLIVDLPRNDRAILFQG